MSPAGRRRQGGETRGPWAALHLRPPPAAPDSQVSGRSQRRGEGGKGATRVPCLEGGSTTNMEKRVLRDTLGQSPDSVPFEPGLSPLPLGPSTGPGLRLQPLAQGGFLCLLSRQRGLGSLLTRQKLV